jgi:hypothetical protein
MLNQVPFRRVGRAGLFTVGWLLAAACGGGTQNAPPPQAPVEPSDSGKDTTGESGAVGEAAEASSAGGDGAPAGNYPVPEVGRRTEEKRTMDASVNIVLMRDDGMAAGMIDRSWSFNEGRRSHVEKASKAGVTVLSVLYGKREGKGLEQWTPLPTEGKAYSIKAAGRGLDIVDQDNKPITSEERAVVEREYGYVGKPHPLLVMLARGKDGEAQNLSREAITSVAGFMPEMEVEAMRARVTGTDKQGEREVSKVELELTGVLTNKETKLGLDLKGPALIDNKSGWVVELALQGTIDVSGHYLHKDKKLKASGKGKIKLGRTTKIL